jgi:hypothetical protein
MTDESIFAAALAIASRVVLCDAAFSRDGSPLVTVDVGGVVKQWDPATREPRTPVPEEKTP